MNEEAELEGARLLGTVNEENYCMVVFNLHSDHYAILVIT
jgi:hypothetical protein